MIRLFPLVLVVCCWAGDGDEAFLLDRLASLERAYQESVRRQTPASAREREALLREVGVLPLAGAAQARATALAARIAQTDRFFAVRAAAARALGRVGGPAALEALYVALFGQDARRRNFELLHEVLPDALEPVRAAEDLAWISRELLAPATGAAEGGAVWRGAQELREAMLELTLVGLGRARARVLAPELAPLARDGAPRIRAAALRALVAMDLFDAALVTGLTDADPAVCAAAASYPGHGPELLGRALAHDAPRVRRAAIGALAARGGVEAIDLLLAAQREERERACRRDLAAALRSLTGKSLGRDPERWRSWWEANRATFAGPVPPEADSHVYFFDVGIQAECVLFLVDVSASMLAQDEQGRSRLERAALELQETLSRLPPEARFAIFAFASEVRRWPDSGEAAPARAAEAVQWLRSRKPAGSTNTYGALMGAFEDPVGPDTMVLLSDGSPYRCSWRGRSYSERDEILAEVRRANEARGVRLHAVALFTGGRRAGDAEDEEAAAAFLGGLAREHGGEFREVR
ncbi:MAG: VWA domain-containing protein [Planctomycetaceae bacterium]